jgi:hypothetical protein
MFVKVRVVYMLRVLKCGRFVSKFGVTVHFDGALNFLVSVLLLINKTFREVVPSNA